MLARRCRLAVLCAVAVAAVALIAPAGSLAAVPGGNGPIIFTDNGELWTIHSDGSALTQLVTQSGHKSSPSFSPDATKIVFEIDSYSGDGANYLYVSDADGANPVQIAGGNAISPAWSPDGAMIAFTRRGVAEQGLWVMNADGSNAHVLVSSYNAELPAWSPDGSKLAYNDNISGNWEIYTVNADGSNRTQITTSSGDQTNFWPDWSPDGTKIAFASNRLCDPYCYSQIYVVNSDGSNLTQLTTRTPADARDPSWSPDGKRIAFIDFDPQTTSHHLYTMKTDGSNIVQLTYENGASGTEDNSPNWGVGPTLPPPSDTTDPTAAIATPPAGAQYSLGQSVTASYSCSDEADGSGIASCVGEVDGTPVADGAVLPTNATGTHTVKVTATDNASNSSSVTRTYEVRADADGDGVVDAIDVGNGAFNDGALTSGSIVNANGLAILVSDAAAPDGVRIVVSGAGAALASISVCGGFSLKLPSPSDVTVTCGSVTVKVTTGSARIELGTTIVVSIPAGVTARVSDTGGGGFSVQNLGGGTVTVTRNGTPSSVAAGQTVSVDSSPPVITANLGGTLGNGGWYRSNVTVTWTVLDGQSAITARTGCAASSVTADTAGRTFTCSATSGGGTTTTSVTVKRDATPPTASYGAHPATYTVDQTIAIGCMTTDAGSGVATSCQPVAGPAYTFGLGSVTRSSIASDLAGNTRTATTSFTVTVTAPSLCALTRQLVQGSPKYAASTTSQRVPADVLVAAGCTALNSIRSNTPTPTKNALRAAYKLSVGVLVQQGWLSSAQGTTLGTLSNSL